MEKLLHYSRARAYALLLYQYFDVYKILAGCIEKKIISRRGGVVLILMNAVEIYICVHCIYIWKICVHCIHEPPPCKGKSTLIAIMLPNGSASCLNPFAPCRNSSIFSFHSN